MSRRPSPPSPSSSPVRRLSKPHQEAFRQLAELQIDAIAQAKKILPVVEVADLIALIKTCTEAITTHRAVVTDDDDAEAPSSLDDRLDTTQEGQREA